VLPGALLLQAPKEALHEADLLWRVRRDEFLPQAVVAARSWKRRLWKTRPLSLRSSGVSPSGRRVPKRLMHASSQCPLGLLGATRRFAVQR